MNGSVERHILPPTNAVRVPARQLNSQPVASRLAICDDTLCPAGDSARISRPIQNLKFKVQNLTMPAFPEISKIPYEGPQSKNPLAFRWYNASEKVEGRTMAEH